MQQLVELSAIDHVCTYNAGPIELVFHFDSDLDASRVVSAFHETVREFAAGARIVKLDEHTLAYDLSRDCAEIRVTGAPGATPLHTCLDSVDLAIGAPLLRARLTQLEGNGTALAVSMSHALADGYAFFLFIAAWAARARGQDFPKPQCDRSMLSDRAARSARAAHADLRSAGLVVLDAVAPTRPYRLEEKLLPPDFLEQHKQQAAAHGLSLNDLLSATLFKQSLQDSTAPEVTLACPVDLRRHRADLGPLFFGNADLHATVRVTPGALRTAPVEEVARWVRAAVADLPGNIASALAALEQFRATHGLVALPRVYVYPPDSGLLVSNLSRIPLDPLDFGAGAPKRVERSAWVPNSRTYFLLPAAGGTKLISSHPN